LNESEKGVSAKILYTRMLEIYKNRRGHKNGILISFFIQKKNISFTLDLL